MTFDVKYLEWNQKRIKGIIDFYGHKFMYYKTILDLGAGHADIGGALYKLGADVTVVDARQEHLKIAAKKFPGIKTIKADLDRGWPFQNKIFDIILDLDLLCHLNDYEAHLRTVCSYAKHLILETAVCDHNDPNKSMVLPENKGIYDLSVNGVSSRPTSAAIERVLTECGMNFKRVDSAKFNSGSLVYDWQPKNNEECDYNKRRIWFAMKSGGKIQLASRQIPNLTIPSLPIDPTPDFQIPHSVIKSISSNVIIPAPVTIQYTGEDFITCKELGKCGRLGNQLFQMAALIDLSIKNQSKIKVKWYCKYTNKNMPTFFKNQIGENIESPNTAHTFNEPHFNYCEIPYHKNMNIHGYFQSEKYFENNKDLIRYYYEPSDSLVNKLFNKYGDILSKNTCSIHVRRGDYVNNKTYYQCTLDYYTRAINRINQLEKIDKFLVFSDDINWCKKNLLGNFMFIEGNQDVEDLFLMSFAKHNILSNSSFSWWGAWLNKNINKKIVVPKFWFAEKSGINDRDIYTEEMILI